MGNKRIPAFSRGDMIKRYETVVQQEINLFKSSLSGIHDRITGISNDISYVEKAIHKEISDAVIQISDLYSKLSGIEYNRDLINGLSVRINGVEGSINKSLESNESLKKEITDLPTKEVLKDKINVLENKINFSISSIPASVVVVFIEQLIHSPWYLISTSKRPSASLISISSTSPPSACRDGLTLFKASSTLFFNIFHISS